MHENFRQINNKLDKLMEKLLAKWVTFLKSKKTTTAINTLYSQKKL
jgi:hypothetical protein